MQSARVRFLLAHAATILLVAAPITAVALWLGARTRHYPYLNDFWPLLFQAAHLDWSNAESFRNGFFPPGYAVYLGLVTGPSILAKAYYTGVALSLGTVLLTYAVTWRLASPPPDFWLHS